MHVSRSKDHADAASYSKLREVRPAIMLPPPPLLFSVCLFLIFRTLYDNVLPIWHLVRRCFVLASFR